MMIKESLPVVISVVHPNIGGWLGSYYVRKNLNPWYASLKKPSWTPPNWVFGPVWTTLYSSIGYSSYLVWRDGGGCKEVALPLSIYGANLALNWAWTPIFFGGHKIKLALYDILLVWGTSAAMAVTFYKVNPLAGLLIIPYFAWCTLASTLNYVIYRDNPQKAIEDKKE
ncbi:PREDICTED: translocator protein [Polistes dominula]|uniref:Translocator protein n=1 Tax=Polistes dominula TaxID=743375 RepID=A0ABM1JFH8_POLDO|nr:PREDICTED: translocator protein [Polistes dominula]